MYLMVKVCNCVEVSFGQIQSCIYAYYAWIQTNGYVKEAQYSSVWLQQLALTNYRHYVTSAWHAKFNYIIRYAYL